MQTEAEGTVDSFTSIKEGWTVPPFEGKAGTQEWPSPPSTVAKYQWPLLYLLQLSTGEGWRQHSMNPFLVLIFSHADG